MTTSLLSGKQRAPSAAAFLCQYLSNRLSSSPTSSKLNPCFTAKTTNAQLSSTMPRTNKLLQTPTFTETHNGMNIMISFIKYYIDPVDSDINDTSNIENMLGKLTITALVSTNLNTMLHIKHIGNHQPQPHINVVSKPNASVAWLHQQWLYSEHCLLLKQHWTMKWICFNCIPQCPFNQSLGYTTPLGSKQLNRNKLQANKTACLKSQCTACINRLKTPAVNSQRSQILLQLVNVTTV